MKWRAYLVLIYGVLLLIGGLIGHVKANSFASLIMGSSSAALILASGWLMLRGQPIGSKIAMILSALLLIFFTYRFLISGKFMPSGLMALISVIILTVLYLGSSRSIAKQ